MQFYLELIQTEHTLKVNLPGGNLMGFLNGLQVSIDKLQRERKLQLKIDSEWMSNMGNKHPSKTTISNEFVRQSLGRHTKNAQSNFEESMVLPFRRIKMRENNNENN
jgi:hypothetical protein